MARYCTQVVSYCDTTTKAGFSCIRTCNINTVSYVGTCVVQLSGGTGGCASTGNINIGNSAIYTVPSSGVSQILIEIWGGGGGGAAIPVCSCAGGRASGGGGGGYSKILLPVTPGAQYTLCAGSGGQGGGAACSTPTARACCCGNKGMTTYVTGPGLSNFCAEGGYGGESKCQSTCQSLQTANGGWAYGGNLNLRGYDGGWHSGWNPSDWCMGFNYGGGSPFGGRNMYIGFDTCSLYSDYSATGKAGGVCGFTGNFPGGGGTGSWFSCCCAICACGGHGAPGMIRIWM